MITWQDIRNKHIIYEDNDVLAINKPTGISVLGDNDKNDLVTLAQQDGETLYPVHRIDKETSGIILFAKTQDVRAHLTRQFNKRTVEKTYLAVVESHDVPEHGTIDLPLSVGRKNKVRVAANRNDIIFYDKKNQWCITTSALLNHKKSYPSVTKFTKIFEDNKYTLLRVNPLTGRRNQIRIHLAWIGHPIVGDHLFEKNRTSQRMLLHAWKISFTTDWSDNKKITLEAKPDDEFWKVFSEKQDVLLEKTQKKNKK